MQMYQGRKLVLYATLLKTKIAVVSKHADGYLFKCNCKSNTCWPNVLNLSV